MNRTLLLCTLLAVIAYGAAAQEQETMSTLTVADAKLGKGVQDREIVDETTTFALNDRVYLWLKVTGGPADSITVTWKTGDQTYSSKLNIGGSSWRTWSYKTAYTAGDWTVTVTDADGNVLKEMAFKVEEMKK
ncbi:MAG: DUF2914 domain-containing protein [Ignavibacterium sp.]|jgi:hypothetical protein